MAEILTQNLGTEDAYSPLIVGLNEAINKLSKVIDFKTSTLSEAKLNNVPTDDEFKNRIYESSNGNRLWLPDPAPVIKKNGKVITTTADGFKIDYVGGAIYFSPSYALQDDDVVTVSCSYIDSDSQTIENIQTELSKTFKTFYGSVKPDDNGNLDPSRPMFAGSGTTVNIEAKGDRVESVTVNGYTQQAGSGDPSPINQRTIIVAGRKMVEVILTGKETYTFSASSSYGNAFKFTPDVAPKYGSDEKTMLSTLAAASSFERRNSNMQKPRCYSDAEKGPDLCFRAGTDSNWTLDQFKAILSTAYNSGKPEKVWYEPDDETQATGIYVPYITEGAEYACQCVKVNNYLCDGDALQSNVPSGCDKVVVFDGSADEKWVLTASGTVNKRFGISEAAVGAVGGKGNFLSNYLPTFTAEEGKQETPYLFVYSGGYVDANIPGIDTVEDWRSHLYKNPLTVRYRSTDYTPEKDIPVCLETHNRTMFVLDGDSGWTWNTVSGVLYRGFIKASTLKNNGELTCTCATRGTTSANQNTIQMATGNLLLNLSGYNGKDDFELFKAYLNENPATVVAELATPTVYAHDPVTITATPYTDTASTASNGVMIFPELPDAPVTLPEGGAADDVPTTLEQPVPMAAGNPGTFDVTSDGTSTVDVYLKAMQDGGNAATAQAVEHALSIQLNGGAATTFNGSEDKQLNITPDGIGAAIGDTSGAANSAIKLKTARNITIGSATKTFDGTAAISYTLAEIGVLDFVYPVGSIFEWCNSEISNAPDLSTPEKVNSYFGGTWERYAGSRVTVSIDSGISEFSKVGNVGGEITHLLTTSEIPNAFNVQYGASGGNTAMLSNQSIILNGTKTGSVGVVLNESGGGAHNNLQPYVVVYRYRRIG